MIQNIGRHLTVSLINTLLKMMQFVKLKKLISDKLKMVDSVELAHLKNKAQDA